MDALQAKMDKASRNEVFEVMPNHPAYSVRTCEMCGAEVDRNGECDTGQHDESRESIALAIQAVEAMSRWSIHEPKLLLCLSVKINEPSLTIRDVAMRVGIGKSQCDQYMRQIVNIFPVLRPILGLNSPKAIAQQKRREGNNE